MFRLLAKYHKTGSVYWQIYHKSDYKQRDRKNTKNNLALAN